MKQVHVHITNIEVPKKILDLERQLEDIRELKNVVVKKQNMRSCQASR
jgi:ATP-dependent Clp protease ATP-binding subunit ClpC